MELGSEFELDLLTLQKREDSVMQYLKDSHVIYMDSGRSAIRVLDSLVGKGVLLLPAYICESIALAYKNKYEIRFYHINRDFSICIEDLEKKLDNRVVAVYIMHYFGKLQDIQILNVISEKKQKYGFKIIEDTTHSIFTKKRSIGDYCICSLRKWFPIMDGGVLYSEKPLSAIVGQGIPHKNPSEKLNAMILKHLHIEGKLDCNRLYRKIFMDEEDKLDSQKEVYYMSDLSKCLLSYFSVSELMEKRKRNYQELDNILKGIGVKGALKGEGFVPLCYPMYIENRDEFRKYLIERQVYCAVHWPLENLESEHNRTDLKWDDTAIQMSRNIISLPIDQRYDKKHVQYLGSLIKDYVERECQK